MDRKTIKMILDRTGRDNRLHPATAKNIETLRRLGYPARFVEFYLYYEPVGTFLFGQVGLYDAESIVADVERDAPGSFVYRHGLLPFACNVHGDEYCFITDGGGSESGVVLLRCRDDLREVGSRDELLACARFCADSFDAFMRRTAEEEHRRARDASYLRRFLNPGQRLKH